MRTPYFGRVISAVPGYPEWMNVIYDDDLAIYVYKPGEEYRNGDLEIVPETEVDLVVSSSYLHGVTFYNAFFTDRILMKMHCRKLHKFIEIRVSIDQM